MTEQRFTPAEVNRLIPELEAIIRSLRKLEGEIQEKEWRLKQAKVEARRAGDIGQDSFLKEEAEIDFLRILAQGQFDRVRDLGGEVKGGYLIDFPGRIGEEDVLLCWKPGETRVTWYHGLYEGMMGRKPIPGDLLGPGGDPETE
ncbi:MAG TPA: DUF2203 domain-containing protein [Symbiobacteriaceae bacterium]|jgi:hypothetical protein|nr:DUF2203 domain-containing protein [Symbiobacteriaceae bacterium]